MDSPIKRAAVIGHPISHSKSPIIHGYWLRHHNIHGSYERIDIAPQDLERDFPKIFDQKVNNNPLCGVNVTIPHKQAVIPLLDRIDDTARAIGAVNTVYRDEKGRLTGTNTDAFGYMANLKAQAPDYNSVLDAAKGRAVHVLGAGGAARAIVYALAQDGARDIRIANRSPEKTAAMIADLGLGKVASAVSWADRHPESDVSLLVNTTSLGMAGQAELEIDIKKLDFSAIISDIVYVPLETSLLRQASEAGLKTVTGLGMLVHQARPAFHAFFGVMPMVDKELEELVLAL